MTEHTWELEQVGPSWHVRGPGARPDLWLDSEDHARLIAAAPDLLALVEDHPMLGDLNFMGQVLGWLERREQVLAAIAKAKGQKP